MLLGRNPDGSERVREYLDPNWVPPSEQNISEQDQDEMSWFEIAQEEDKHVQPIIREDLGPLMVIPGYVYDEKQYQHLQDVAIKTGKDPSKVPTMGYFEFSRAYSRDVEKGKEANVLCARQIPDWIPSIAFKNIFSIYSNVNNLGGNLLNPSIATQNQESYPIVTMINSKKEAGRTVLVTFDPTTKDAIFALLMTRKVRIVHPKYDKKSSGTINLDGKVYKISELKCTLIFDHAYEYDIRSSSNNSVNNSNSRFQRPIPDHKPEQRTDYKSEQRPDRRTKYTTTNKTGKRDDKKFVSKEIVKNRDDVDISKYNYTKK